MQPTRSVQHNCRILCSILLFFFVASVAFLSWLHWNNVLLGFVNDNGIWHHHLCSHLAFRIVCQHDGDFHPQHSLAHGNVTDSRIDVVLLRLTCGNEITILEFHRFRTLRTNFSADDDFAALRTIFHDESNYTIASTTNRKSAKELVSERLRLRSGACGSVFHSLSKKLHAVL